MTGATMTLAQCARRLGAKLVATNPAARFVGVSTDSRKIAPGQLFVAMKGPSFDGHDYVSQIHANGAAAALVSKPVDSSVPQMIVGDTMWAYGHLAQFWRSQFRLPVLALTGSNGKTTVKEMLRAIMVAHYGDADSVLATEGNLNNNIGLPQMMLRLASTHRAAVLEMGMNHLREIDYLTRLAVPDVAIINMAGTAHIGELGSREAIAEAKGEIYAGLRDEGVACINIDDRFANYWKTLVGSRRVVAFGTAEGAEVRGVIRDSNLTLSIDGKSAAITLNVVGEHNLRNAIAAAAGAHAIGVSLNTIASGLAGFHGVDGRLRTYAGHNSATIIDDTYNANPDSMRAAIAVLAGHTGKRLLVLGDMGELGSDAPAMHAEIGAAARAANIDGLYVLGDLAREYITGFGTGGANSLHATSADALINAIKAQLSPDTVVLVKGSRFMRMERVVAGLLADAARASYGQKGSH